MGFLRKRKKNKKNESINSLLNNSQENIEQEAPLKKANKHPEDKSVENIVEQRVSDTDEWISFLEKEIEEKEVSISKIEADFKNKKEEFDLKIAELESRESLLKDDYELEIMMLKDEYDKKTDMLVEELRKEVNLLEMDLLNQELNLSTNYAEKEIALKAKHNQKESDLINSVIIEKEKLNKDNENKLKELNNKQLKFEEKQKLLDLEFETKKRRLSEEFIKKQESLEKEIVSNKNRKWRELEDFLSSISSQLKEEHNDCYKKLNEVLIDLSEGILDSHRNMAKISEEKIEQAKNTKANLTNETIKVKDEMIQSIKEAELFSNELSNALDKEYEIKRQTLKSLESIIKEEAIKNKTIERKNELKLIKRQKREMFIEKYHLEKVFNWTEKHKLLSLALIFVFIFLICATTLIAITGKLHYKVNPDKVIGAAINGIFDYPSYKSNSILYFDGENDLINNVRDSVVYFTTEYNEENNETHKTYSISNQDNDFIWERFIKNDLKILKTPYESQYIQIEDFRDYGFLYNDKEFVNFFKKPIFKLLASMHKSDYNVIEKQEQRDVIPNGIRGYFSYYFLPPESTSYYYEINVTEEQSNLLFNSMVNQLIVSENFKSFLVEEKALHEKLRLENNLIPELERLTNNMMKNVLATSANIELNISKDSQIESIGLHFELILKDGNNNTPFMLHYVTAFDDIGETEDVEKHIFTMNSMKFSEIFPRLELENFKTSVTMPVIEKTSTLKDMEKDNIIDYNPSGGKEDEPLIVDIPIVDVSVETDVDLNIEIP